MKKISFMFVLSLLLIILQQAVFSSIKLFGGVTFDIVYVYVICVSLMRSESEGFWISLFTGMIVDCFFPLAYGINTIVYLLTFYMCNYVQKRLYRDVVIVPVIMTFIFTFFKGIMIYSFLYLLSQKYNFIYLIGNVLIYEAIYNSILSVLIHKIIAKVNSSKMLKEDWKF